MRSSECTSSYRVIRRRKTNRLYCTPEERK